MRQTWRLIGVGGGTIAVFIGALLIMGSFDSHARSMATVELTRVQNQARHWGSRLSAARSTLRDSFLRFQIAEIMEHPQDFAESRVRQRFAQIGRSWPGNDGHLRGLLLLLHDGTAHSMWGDTSGATAAVNLMHDGHSADMALLPSEKRPPMLAVEYRVTSNDLNRNPGFVVAMFDAPSVLSVQMSVLQSWGIYADDGSPVLTSKQYAQPASLNASTWQMMATHESGVLDKTGGPTFAFSKINVPGMPTLVVVSPLPGYAWSGLFAMLLLLAGAIIAIGYSRPPISPARSTAAHSLSETPNEAGVEALSYRAIFHALSDPICIVNSKGRVVRSNRPAADLLQFHLRNRDVKVTLAGAVGDLNVRNFLSALASKTSPAEYHCKISPMEGPAFDGSVLVTRLFGETKGNGPLLLHFRPDAMSEERLPASEYEQIPDPQSPYPVIYVTQEGLIQLYNDAALRTCPRIKESPLISDVLPSVDPRELTALFGCTQTVGFESLFGSSPHSFEVVPIEDGVLLYAHPLSASQTLEVALRQSQENFNTLCGVIPVPVLLVDPRNHTIHETNPAANEFFHSSAEKLNGRIFDSLACEPIDVASNSFRFVADTPDGPLQCRAHGEMVKVEGSPMILVVIQPPAEYCACLADQISRSQDTTDSYSQTAESREVTPGPSILVCVNPAIRDVTRRMLEDLGHPCEAFSRLDDATFWLIANELRPDLVCLDIGEFPEAGDWLEDIRIRYGRVPCLALTDGVTFGMPNNGSNAYLIKPFDADTMVEAMNCLGLPVYAANSESHLTS
jgi:PAS domain-containing protein